MSHESAEEIHQIHYHQHIVCDAVYKCYSILVIQAPTVTIGKLKQRVSRVLHPTQDITGHCGYEFFQAITCTGIDN